MREVKAVKINAADFAPYGTFCSMTEPEGYPLEERFINSIRTASQEPVLEQWHFHRLKFARTKELSRWQNIIQLHGKGLLLLMTTCLSMLHLLPAEHRFRTCEGFPCTKGMHGKDQCSDLASVSTSGE